MQLLHTDIARDVCLMLERVGNVYYIRRMAASEVQIARLKVAI